MFYIKSISGQVYEVEEMPQFSAGYTVVSKAEYEEWLKKLLANSKKMLDKQPKVWYNGYRKKRGEQNVQDYQWCGCLVRGAVCVRDDYGEYVKKG